MSDRAEIVELKRLLHNVVRSGTVAAVDHTAARARLQDGDLLTDWLPWLERRAGTTRSWNPPTVGEQALLLCQGGDPADGVIITGLYSDTHPAPDSSAEHFHVDMPDGAVIEYDHAAHHLQATIPGSATIDAATDIAAHAGGAIEATAAADITATTQANLTATAAGLATLTAAGGATVNAHTVINGNLALNGSFAQIGSTTAIFNSPVDFTKSVTHNGVPIDSSHTHGGVESGDSNTGPVSG